MGTVSTLRASRTPAAQRAMAHTVSASEQCERLATAHVRFMFAWQRVVLRSFLVCIAAAGLSGCSTLDIIDSGITRYCGATAAPEREVIRARVNARVHPNQIQIHCAD